MKSNFLMTRNTSKDKNLTADAQIISVIEDKAVASFLDSFEKIYFSETKQDEEKIVSELAKQNNITNLSFVQLLRLSKSLASVFLNETPTDTPENIVNDFLELDFIRKDDSGKFLSFLKNLKSISQKIKPEYKKELAKNSAFPSLSGLHSSVEFRIVFDEVNKTTVDKNYTPKVLDIVPIAIITLHLDEGPNEHVYFQVDEKRLEILSNYLLNLQKEIEVAKKMRIV
jgi:hypothetical protein